MSSPLFADEIGSRSQRGLTVIMRRGSGRTEVEEKSTKGQQKLGEGENWELRLLAGSFSVLPRISRGTDERGDRGGGCKRGERGSRGGRGPFKGHHTSDTGLCEPQRGKSAKITGRGILFWSKRGVRHGARVGCTVLPLPCGRVRLGATTHL